MGRDDEPVGYPRDPRQDYSDYRPDLMGHVEGPPDAPAHIMDAALAATCSGCIPNVFVEHDETHPSGYVVKIAHDETCPWMAGHESTEEK